MNECLENLQSQTDANLARSQEVCIKLALTVQWDPIQNALKIAS
jgi:hypothetical protein